jgi:hypothetical protein
VRRLVAGVLVLTVACSGGSPAPTIKLDGSLHPPSDAGVVTSADRHQLVLDGTRRYSVNPHLIVFTPGTLQISPLAGAVGRFALIGTHGHRVDWVEPLSVVAALPGAGPTVFLFGTLARLTGGMAAFADGTVLPTDPSVAISGSLPLPVRADIDPSTHHIRMLQVQ